MYPSRIVCLTEEPTEVLYALGEEARIVGISGFTVRPARARKEKPRVSAFTSAKVDEITRLTPDLAVGFSDIQADIAQAAHRTADARQPAGIAEAQRAVDQRAGAGVPLDALQERASEIEHLFASLKYRRALASRGAPQPGHRPRQQRDARER